MNAKDVEMHMAEVAVNNALATARDLRGALLAVLNRSCSDAARGDALARAQKACEASAWVDDFNPDFATNEALRIFAAVCARTSLDPFLNPFLKHLHDDESNSEGGAS